MGARWERRKHAVLSPLPRVAKLIKARDNEPGPLSAPPPPSPSPAEKRRSWLRIQSAFCDNVWVRKCFWHMLYKKKKKRAKVINKMYMIYI